MHPPTLAGLIYILDSRYYSVRLTSLGLTGLLTGSCDHPAFTSDLSRNDDPRREI
jgi:hypothetical protein